MKRFKSILYYTTGRLDSSSFETAIDLARRNNGTLSILAVAPHDVGRSGLIENRYSDLIEVSVFQHQEAAARRLVDFAADEGVAATSVVRVGSPFIVVIQEVLRNNHDIVIVVAEDEEAEAGWFYSSTTMHLLRKCPVPVWALKGGETPKISTILAAVAPTDPGEHAASLNTMIMDLATSLSAIANARLLVLNTYFLEGKSLLAAPGRLSPEEISELETGLKGGHAEALESLVDKYRESYPDLLTRIEMGRAEHVIPLVASGVGADLVVMGTVSRTGVPGFLLGNTAERTLQRLQCSLLTVKPSSFETPVKLP